MTEPKLTKAQLDIAIADVLAGPSGSPAPGTKVRCSYRGDHVGRVLAIDDPKAWAGTAAFPMVNPKRAAIKAHILKHPTVATRTIPVLYNVGMFWDARDSLTPVVSAPKAAPRRSAKSEAEQEADLLHEYARGAHMHDTMKRARLGYVVQGILRDRGIDTHGMSDRDLASRCAVEAAKR